MPAPTAKARSNSGYYKPNAPHHFSVALGSMSIDKGKIVNSKNPKDQIQFYQWDAVKKCIHEECPAYEYCAWRGSQNEKCTAVTKFLRHVVNALVFNQNPRKLNNEKIFRIGTELIPLYHQLVEMFIVELGVRQNQIISKTKQKTTIHPVYKEIREIQKSIANARRMIGISTIVPAADRVISGEEDDILPFNQRRKRISAAK